MEDALLNQTINRGTDNVFANIATTNANNIERIDFIFNDGLVVPTDLVGEGFTIMDRGGNDYFKISAITSLGEDGLPNGFGSVVSINNTDWGASDIQTNTPVLSKDSPSDDFEMTADVHGQYINGVFISYEDLGLSPSDQIFGYSLAGADVSDDQNHWLEPSNANYFPTDTDENSDGGGLDLMAGGKRSG